MLSGDYINNPHPVGNWSEDQIVALLSLLLGLKSLNNLCKMVGSESFCRRIMKLLQNADRFVNNAGHDCLPPDYYSDEMNIMFDVMRVNDSECRKGRNPVMLDLRSIKVDCVPGRFGPEYHIIDLLPDCDKGLNFDNIHRFEYYQRQSLRVISKHVQKLDVWKQEHPKISRKGFVVLDETGLYFKGRADPIDMSTDLWKFCFEHPICVYEPWLDKRLIEPLIASELDFLVWFNLLANMSRVNKTVLRGHYPAIVLVDLRHSIDNLIEYDVTSNWFSAGFDI